VVGDGPTYLSFDGTASTRCCTWHRHAGDRGSPPARLESCHRLKGLNFVGGDGMEVAPHDPAPPPAQVGAQ
jgi:hypothetical protein